MKKFLLVLIMFMLTCSPVAIMDQQSYLTAYANSNDKQYITINDLETFISRAGKNRSSFSRGEKDAATYLASIMQENGLDFYKDTTSYLKEFVVGEYKSQNVIGVKKTTAENAKKVILGAHYDNAYTILDTQTNSAGIFDNASGVLCLIAIMKELKEANLPFDIIFIFYGAEENGLNGSKNFVNSMSSLEKKNTILAINYDSIGAGDYNYFYCGDSDNSYKHLFINSYGIKNVPLIKRINMLPHFEGFAYTSQGLLSDNAIYLKNNIKCTSFFSGNLSHSGVGFVEVEGQDDIIHTDKDNLEYIINNRPNFVSNINDVCNLSIDVLTNPNLVTILENSSNNINLFFLNNKYIVGLIYLVCILIVINLKPKNFKENSEK